MTALAGRAVCWGSAGVVILLAALLPAAPVRAEEDDVLSDQAIEARIRNVRSAETTLTVTGADGKPLADTEVVVAMRRHKFLFGALFRLGRAKDEKLEEAYLSRFAELMNYATLPVFWGSYEYERGHTREAHLRASAEWCRDHGIRPKGHPLVYHYVPAPWHKDLPVDELRDAQLERVEREVKAFAGLVDTWDVVNEIAVMQVVSEPMGAVCRAMGPEQLLTAAFGRARAASPNAVLILNENRPDESAPLLRKCLEAEVPIDVLGIQAHMHGGYPGARRIWDKAERLSDLGVPQHWTETTLVSGRLKTWQSYGNVPDWVSTPKGEERQAREVVEFYRVLFSHPAVDAITWWDFSDDRSWQGAPAGLLRKDMSPKPAYDALKKLIKRDWWTGPLTLKTDAAGRVTFRGFLGEYEMRAGQATARFSLDTPGKAARTVAVHAECR